MTPFRIRAIFFVVAFALSVALCAGPAPEALAQTGPQVVAAKGAWSATVTYAIDDLVIARGSTWRSKRNGNKNKVPGSTSPNNNAYWELFAAGFNPLGAWSAATQYQPNDIVTSGGSTWRAKLSNKNKTPVAGANWQLFAVKGNTGATGATGPAGPNTGVGLGSLATPAISFSGNASTGIFAPTAGRIAMVEGGVLFLHNLGTNNAAFGLSALAANTTGTDNVAVGRSALAINTAGGYNTAVGSSALEKNTGSYNTAVGYLALGNNISADSNTAVGNNALAENTFGFYNTAIGQSAMVLNTTGHDNTALGRAALRGNTDGNSNTAVGNNALFANTIGASNTAVGLDALKGNTEGLNNTALGAAALSNNDLGSSNVALGTSALVANTIGNNNIAVGEMALNGNTEGSDNIAIGYQAGMNALNDAGSNIFIGSPGAAGDTSPTIRIGNTQTRAFVAGIRGKTTGAADAVAVLIDSNGQLGTVSSSRRYKFDIRTMDDMSEALRKLRPVTFRYKQAQSDGSHPVQYGLIAEEVAEVLPDLAVFNADGLPETVKYHLLPSLLLPVVQQQQRTIDTQAQRIKAQAEQTAALEQRLRNIEAMLSRQTAVQPALLQRD